MKALSLLLAFHLSASFGESLINLTSNPCAQVLGCKCVDSKPSDVVCHSIARETLDDLSRFYSKAERFRFYKWFSESVDLDLFANFTNLQELWITDGYVEDVTATKLLKRLKTLDLSENYLQNHEKLCSVFPFLPSLQTLNVAHNLLGHFGDCAANSTKSLTALKLNDNQIANIGELPTSLQLLDVSFNYLTDARNISRRAANLNISNNPITSWKKWVFPNLVVLDASTVATESFSIEGPLLQTLYLDNAKLRFLNFHRLKTPNLKRISAKNTRNLEVLSGSLPPRVNQLFLTNTKLRALPQNFFASTNISTVDLSGNDFDCDSCVLRWAQPVFSQLEDLKAKCKLNQTASFDNCTLGISKERQIQRGLYGTDSIITCAAYGNPMPSIKWYRYRPVEYLGSYDPQTDKVDTTNVSESAKKLYSVTSGGQLLLKNVNRSSIERYICVAENMNGIVYEPIHFRLDYTNWYSLNIFNSVFWGGLATAFLVCAVSFLFNITWILTRKSILWWIQRAERLSRVRKMVEAMEKYRARQMESLHDKYTKRVQLVSDNYHQQVEALRISYTAQADKFRDYRTAQMGAVSAQLDNIRDNYNSQLARVREYGSKRAEQLWESYERQVNRMRAFSLQQRLKLMRQYKVKQRYLNKLLESFQDTSNPEEMLKHEEEVRAALELPEAPPLADADLPGSAAHLSRTSSFLSLPEYVIDEEGFRRPSPLTGASSSAVRFAPIQPVPKSTTKSELEKPRSDSSPQP